MSWLVGASVCLVFGVLLSRDYVWRWIKRKHYTRGHRLKKPPNKMHAIKRGERPWGAHGVSLRSARQHMLGIGTSGSGKSNLLRRTLKCDLLSIKPGSDRRVFCYDSENDVVPYLLQIGVQCPVFSLNPIESRRDFPIAVRWDVSADVTNPAKALSLATKFVPEENEGGNGKFFSNMARILQWGVINSFNRHAPKQWSYSDLVFAAQTSDHVIQILNRDSEGRRVLAGVFRDAKRMNVTADNIFSTLYSKMAFHMPVAALWQRTSNTISLRDWLKSDSILLLGTDDTMEEAFNLINGMVFSSFVDEMGAQTNSSTRDTIAWLDELRDCKAILQSGKFNRFLNRMRKKGGRLVGGFQDIEGFRHACGSKELANEIIGQCSHKALGRLESPETAQWASDLLGKFETIEVFQSYQGNIASSQRSSNEQVRVRANVLPSEFFSIEEPSPETGVEAYFLSPGRSPYRKLIPASEFTDVVVSDEVCEKYAAKRRGDSEQELIPWTIEEERLLLGFQLEENISVQSQGRAAILPQKNKTPRFVRQGRCEERKQYADGCMQSLSEVSL